MRLILQTSLGLLAFALLRAKTALFPPKKGYRTDWTLVPYSFDIDWFQEIDPDAPLVIGRFSMSGEITRHKP